MPNKRGPRTLSPLLNPPLQSPHSSSTSNVPLTGLFLQARHLFPYSESRPLSPILLRQTGFQPPPAWLTSTRENQSTAPSFSNPSSYTAYTVQRETVTPLSFPSSLPQLNHLVSPFTCHSMSSDNQSLSQVTRSKLSLVIGGGAKDTSSLHRWVLLKNSISRSQPQSTLTCSPNNTSELLPTYNSTGDEDDEVCFDVEHDSFIYPDARKLLHTSCSAHDDGSEKQWFESLFESLEDEDPDDSLHVGDDDDEDDLAPLTPSASPMSSTDDLSHPVYNNSPISMPYPVVYPPYNPPLLSPLELQPINTSLDSSYPPFNVALPYNAEDDTEDLPVPDTVEDLSDDESDALSALTPDARSPSLSLVDASARSSERARRHVVPQVYVSADDSFLRHGLELDPLPFAHDSANPSHAFEGVYAQEC